MSINTHFFMETLFAIRKAKSHRGNTCMQLFVSDTDFIIYVYPMKSKPEILDSMKAFAKDIDVPTSSILDT